VQGLDAFTEGVELAKAAVAMAFGGSIAIEGNESSVRLSNSFAVRWASGDKSRSSSTSVCAFALVVGDALGRDPPSELWLSRCRN